MRIKSVKVCGTTYKVVRRNLPRNLWGRFDAAAQTIEVCKGITDHMMARVILHELIHAIGDNYGIKLSERDVLALEVGTTSALCDNPKLWKALKHG